MIIDWEQLVGAPAVSALAQLVRARWGVWVGVAQPGQPSLPLGRGAALAAPLCARFRANPGLEPSQAQGAPQTRSCAGSVAAWADAQGREGCPRCVAGLDALRRPILLHGQPLGVVFASGFLRAQALEDQRLLVQERLGALDAELPALLSPALQALPVLSVEQEQLLGLTLEALADALASHAQELAARAPRHAQRLHGMLGASAPMLRLFSTIERVARTSSTVLILGENGTGKELIARAVHAASRRHDRPFVVQNCAAIPPELMESELFGHKRGAFSGAHRDRMGLFEVADQGTFFLDEIGELEPSLQAKLLRVLQEGTFLPVGDTLSRKVDVRIICATNRDLAQLVREGKFREDLYYRINVITLHSPPLRERQADIPLLAHHFAHKAARVHSLPFKALTPACLEVLQRYAWPGNVRQLENELERALILSGDRPALDADMLSPHLLNQPERPLSFGQLGRLTLPEAVELLERRMILDCLEENGWNKTQAAKRLGVSRRNLIRKVASYGFEGGAGLEADSQGSEADED